MSLRTHRRRARACKPGTATRRRGSRSRWLPRARWCLGRREEGGRARLVWGEGPPPFGQPQRPEGPAAPAIRNALLRHHTSCRQNCITNYPSLLAAISHPHRAIRLQPLPHKPTLHNPHWCSDKRTHVATDRGFRCCVSNYHGLPRLRTLGLEPTPLRGLMTAVR